MHHLTRSHWQRTDECVTSTVVSLPPFHTLAPRPSRSHFHLAPIGPSQASPSTHPNPQTSHLHPPLLGIRICNNIWLHSIHRTHVFPYTDIATRPPGTATRMGSFLKRVFQTNVSGKGKRDVYRVRLLFVFFFYFAPLRSFTCATAEFTQNKKAT